MVGVRRLNAPKTLGDETARCDPSPDEPRQRAASAPDTPERWRNQTLRRLKLPADRLPGTSMNRSCAPEPALPRRRYLHRNSA